MTSKKERRLKILSVAAELFFENGYERTSMDEINKRAGGSKGTLYRYFPSKEELFAEAIAFIVSEKIEGVINAIHKLKRSKEDVWDSLISFGINYLNLHLSPDMLKITRIIIAEAERMNIGKTLYQCGQEKGWKEITRLFESLINDGKLRKVEAGVASVQLKGLFDAGPLDNRLRGIVADVSDAEIRQHVEMAVDTFRRAYQV